MTGRPLFYLVSTAGIPNLGDELIAATWVKYLAEYAPDADVVVDCVDPAAVVAPLTTLHPRLRLVSTLWQLCFRNWSAGLGAADEVRAAVADPERAADLREGIELLHRADVVHLTGGGFLNNMWPAFAGLLSGITAATVRSGGRAAMTGVGLFPPAAGGEELIRSLAAEFAVVDVRDTASAELLADPAALSCDDVFLYPRSWRDEEATDLPDVMVSVQFTLRPTALFPPGANAAPPAGSSAASARERAAQRGMSGLLALVSKTVAEWGAREVGVLECWPDADRDVLEAALRVLPRARLFTLDDVLRRGFPARPGQTWFSTRFHPHLLASAAGASGVAVSLREDYYGTKHRSLTDHGSPWQLAQLDVLGPEAPAVPRRPDAGGYRPDRLDAHQAAKRRVAQRIYGVGPSPEPGPAA
ncbi:MAG: hypothetical protein QOF98_2753 [Streptomyces sp.]|nr:hypothetical protein [Streptomyces sp.]